MSRWNHPNQGFKKGHKINLGKPSPLRGRHFKMSDEARENHKKAAPKGEKNYNWRGKNIPYRTLHAWVRRRLGRPGTCQFCGKTGLWGKQINWANKDHKYKRNLTDWLRLCVKCHKNYDKELQVETYKTAGRDFNPTT